jgi:hypothetical protein
MLSVNEHDGARRRGAARRGEVPYAQTNDTARIHRHVAAQGVPGRRPGAADGVSRESESVRSGRVRARAARRRAARRAGAAVQLQGPAPAGARAAHEAGARARPADRLWRADQVPDAPRRRRDAARAAVQPRRAAGGAAGRRWRFSVQTAPSATACRATSCWRTCGSTRRSWCRSTSSLCCSAASGSRRGPSFTTS